MKERPILFSAAMVQAILDGRKTQTRRVMKVQPAGVTWWWHGQEADARKGLPTMREVNGKGWAMCGPFKCPYIADGMFASLAGELMPSTMYGSVIPSKLWVRESWRTYASLDHCKPRDIEQGAGVQYEAGGSNIGVDSLYGMGKLRPSIFMPRWMSRVLLEITSVRVEPLFDITEEDAIAEGLEPIKWPDGSIKYQNYASAAPNGIRIENMTAKNSYFTLWEAINGRKSLEANPWVWVITYKVVEIKR